METQPSELTDWEFLHNSADSANSVRIPQHLGPTEDYSEGIIRVDYFSVDSQTRYATRDTVAGSSEEAGSVESDNPSWVDPVLHDNLVYRKETSELWSDSLSDDQRTELGFVGNEDSQAGFEGFENSQLGSDGIGEIGFLGNEDSKVGFEGIGETSRKSGEIGSFDVGNENHASKLGEFESVSVREELGFVDESDGVDEIDRNSSVEGANVESDVEFDAKNDVNVDDSGVTEGGVKPVGKVEKRSLLWWKGPLEFLKYCVFRVSPVWSVSVAAAMVGCVILGRRLYRMKRKSRGLEIKVTVDEKKVSQFMSRAARLNEAFSVVRRVPVVRPVLPGPGMTSWPVIGLR